MTINIRKIRADLAKMRQAGVPRIYEYLESQGVDGEVAEKCHEIIIAFIDEYEDNFAKAIYLQKQLAMIKRRILKISRPLDKMVETFSSQLHHLNEDLFEYTDHDIYEY